MTKMAKIELICQQPQESGAHPSSEVPERMTGGWWGGLAMLSVPSVLLSISVKVTGFNICGIYGAVWFDTNVIFLYVKDNGK